MSTQQIKLKDRSALDKERLASLSKLDGVAAFTFDVILREPNVAPKGMKCGYSKSITTGLVALHANFSDFKCSVQDTFGDIGVQLVTVALKEKYGADSSAKYDDWYTQFRKETLETTDYKEWT